MIVEIFVFSQDVVMFIDSVIKYFELKLVKQLGKIICLLIKVSGCIGYVYVLDFVDVSKEDDEIFNVLDLFIVVVVKDVLQLICNIEIDYVQEGINGVIKYYNLNVVDECGCGESFNVG